jgi:ATP-dependent 26S proteasome regulatory subunit
MLSFSGLQKERKMLMEVQPVAVDPSITFKSVGGLDSFINKLKEIVIFPLVYHEYYSQTGMSAPRGILLHGPPGRQAILIMSVLCNLI